MKMKSFVVTASLASAFFMMACNKDNDNGTTSNVNGQDTTFIQAASKSNQAEIEMGNLAITKGTNDSVLMFAQMMITDHTTAQTKLRSLVDSVQNTITLSDSLDADQVAMRNTLQSLSGAAFDSAYIAGQIAGHQKTLAAFNAEIGSGQNAQVKTFATNNQPIIQSHLTMASQIATQLK